MDVGSERGNGIRRKVYEVREIMRNAMKAESGFKGSSVKALDEFLDAALLKKETVKQIS